MADLIAELLEDAKWVEANAHHHFSEHQKHDPLRQSLRAAENIRKAHAILTELLASRTSPATEAVAWLVRRYGHDGWLIGDEVYLQKPDIKSTSRTDFIPLYATPQPVAVKVTDDMVAKFITTASLASGSTEKCVRAALTAALSSGDAS